MKVTISKNELQKAFETLSSAVPRKPTIHALSYVNIKFEEKEENVVMKLMATDLELTMIYGIITSKDNVVNPKEVCIDHSSMLSLLKNLDEQPLILEIDNKCSVKTSKGSYDIMIIETEEFPLEPVIDEPVKFKLSSDILKKIVSASSFASNDDLRPTMCGVSLISNNGKVSIAATDANYLVKMTALLDLPSFEVIMPPKSMKTIKDIANMYDEINVNVGNRNISFAKGIVKATIRLTEGKYPNYDSVIPNAEPMTTISMPATDMLKALSRVSINANAANMATLEKKGLFTKLAVSNVDYGTESTEELTAVANGEDTIVGLSIPKIQEILKAVVKSNITIEITEPSRAVVIKPEDDMNLVLLLMPMMVTPKTND